MKKVIIIGAGLAGLISAIRLSRQGVPCILIEKKRFPFHRVCGEYISNEVTPFLKREGLYPDQFQPTQLKRFRLSSVSGKSEILPLDLGGFGISRFALDEFLYRQALDVGVTCVVGEVDDVITNGNDFTVKTSAGIFDGDVVIGSFGKRSKLDIRFNRSFTRKRSPYVGIKYHIKSDNPADLISLHNFDGGYCGVSNVEDGKTNLCYLVHRDTLRKHGDIDAMEQEVLSRNPFLRRIFSEAEFLFDKPEVINEISFETKSPVENHILMAGDAAGMITPLCGNGMAMAIHSAVILSDLVTAFCQGMLSRDQLEKQYANQWKRNFAARLWAGRQIQRLFGSSTASNIAITLALYVKPMARTIIRNTHGRPF